MADIPHIMIVESPYYEEIANLMLESVLIELKEYGATYERFEVPGSFELPGAIRIAIEGLTIPTNRKSFDGYIALGCVIRGETSHYDYVCGESARGLNDLVLKYGIALGYGVLTTENKEQALARASRGQHDRGGAAARACLAMIDLKRKLTSDGQ
ncbi:MAG: 6,7-dimethyl-8-ribityllumazine synthase [Pseudomonadota bacterium]|nr:6,7-dimethyl-8-ribityllumazine synthase [Pseudomonadota bacterium]